MLAGLSTLSTTGAITLTPKALTAEGDRVAAETESYAELSNGRVYNNHYHFVFELSDGRIPPRQGVPRHRAHPRSLPGLTSPSSPSGGTSMDVGVLLVFQNWFSDKSDEEVFRDDVELGVLAEEYGLRLGVDGRAPLRRLLDVPGQHAGAVLPGRAHDQRIKLGTGAVILPWNDPLRVVEKIIDARPPVRRPRDVRHGPRPGQDGVRGASASTWTRPRERFDEAAAMIIKGLEDGYRRERRARIYQQPRVDIRPGPTAPWTDRLFGVAMSPDSMPGDRRRSACR